MILTVVSSVATGEHEIVRGRQEDGMIDSFKFGQIVVDGKTYTSDVIVFPGRVDDTWWRKTGHNLCVEDIEAVMNETPEVVVVGTGVDGLMKVPDETRSYIESSGADLIVERTKKACELYNRVCGKSRVIAALHLTC